MDHIFVEKKSRRYSEIAFVENAIYCFFHMFCVDNKLMISVIKNIHVITLAMRGGGGIKQVSQNCDNQINLVIFFFLVIFAIGFVGILDNIQQMSSC